MNLELNTKVLWYFPHESKKDTPLYAIQPSKEKHYEKFIQLTTDDEFITETHDGKLFVQIGGIEIDYIDKKKKKELRRFQDAWNRGISFLKGEEPEPTQEIAEDEEEHDHVVGLKNHLQELEDQFLETKDLRIRYISWNLKGDTQLSGRITTQQLKTLLGGDDIYTVDCFFIGFQEIIPLSAKNFRSSQIAIDNWITKISELLPDDKYEVIATNKLLGLSSILLIRSELAINFSKIDISSLGTGLLNLYGNKGAILTKVQMNDQFELSFINCHFAAGENDSFLLKRRREFQGVGKYFELNEKSNGVLATTDESILFDVDEVDALNDSDTESDEETGFGVSDEDNDTPDADADDDTNSGDKSVPSTSQKVEVDARVDSVTTETSEPISSLKITTQESSEDIEGDQNIILIGGDLNYRLSASNEIITALIKEKDYRSLLEYDSLLLEKDQGRILKNFKEGDIKFPPTYKFAGEDYDPERKPSYTDRIFHSESKFVKIQRYSSPQIFLSDHTPVISDFEVTLPIINNEKRNKLVKKFFKLMDDKVNNTNRTTFIIEDLETTKTIPILTNSTIDVKLINLSPSKITWEIIDSQDQIEKNSENVSTVPNRIEPLSGIIPKKGEQILKVSATLPIGCSKFTKTIVLRSLNNQDFFIIANFVAKKSYFGSTIDDLNLGLKTNSGIPKQIYTLIDYLTQHMTKDMLDETKLSYTHDLEKHIIQWIDADEGLKLEELQKADDFIKGSSSRAVCKVLLLLLRNLDGGIVSQDLSTYLLDGFASSNNINEGGDIMENILEKLPPLRANVLIYLTNFLRLCLEIGEIPKNEILNKFEDLLIEVPKPRKRDLMLRRSINYEKLRREFLSMLIG